MLVPRNKNLMVGAFRPAESGLDRLFEGLFDDLPTVLGEGNRTPAINSWEDDQAYHVEAELPGLEEKDIDLSVTGNELHLRGEHTEEKAEHEKAYHWRERRVGKFVRTMRFPVDIDAAKVTAALKNGVLEITLPKAEAALPRKIEVKG